MQNNYERKIWLKEQHTITAWLDKSIKKHMDNVAIVDGDIRLTYKSLGEKIKQYAATLYLKGIRKRDNVILQMHNSVEYVITVFALLQIGAVPVITNHALRGNELIGIAKKTSAIAYIHSGEFMGYSYNRLANRIFSQITSITLTYSAEEIKQRGDTGLHIDVYNAAIDETAILMMSGGTTGEPKIVPLSHSMLYWHINCYIEKFGLDSSSVYLAILPLTHKFALYSPGLLNILAVGGKIVMCKTGSCDEAFPLIAKEDVTITCIVPALARMWLDYLDWDYSYKMSSLKRIVMGGSMIDKALIHRFIDQLGCEVQIGYGATEGILMYSIYDETSTKISNGYRYLVSGYEDIKIIDENGEYITDNKAGELIIKSPYTITGYYNSDDSNIGFTNDGYYRTGDKARISSDGEYQILGRIVDQINRAGEKIEPSEIEKHMNQYPGIREVVLVGVEDDILGERSCAFIISNNRNIKLNDINNYLSDKGLAQYKMPDQLIYIEKWPLTSVNKIDKTRLRNIAKESK